jgi:hypothetical protein
VVAVRLADDERARVPFALVGVVLLVGSAALAATMARQGGPTDDPAAGTAIESAQSGGHAAVHRAVQRAARDAGRNPVVEPADTTYGRVLDDSEPFRDYLRVRIYLAVERALAGVTAREDDVVATLSIPRASNASTLRDGKRHVHVEPGENRSAGLRVRVRNVTVTAYRGDRVLDRQTYTPTVVVSTPVLALHERTKRFESRLNRDPLDGPGLGRRLTARTYALAWVRGYAQYGGTPIENVVGNRHVELLTNGAVLREQRRAFGHGDPAGRHAMARATGKVAATDLTGPSNVPGDRWVEYLSERADEGDRTPTDVPALADPDSPRRTNTTVGVNRSADEAFARFVDGTGPDSLDSVLASVYSADVKLAVDVRRTDERTWTTGRRPENGTLLDEGSETSVRVRSASGANASAPPGWDLYRSYSRTVVRTHTTTKRWRVGNRTVRSQRHREVTRRVVLGVVGKPAPRAPGPPGEIAALYERGGPLDGPNMADVPQTAVARLVEARGGPDELARRAVAGSLDSGVETIRAERPEGLAAWVYADLAGLRERTRNVTVAVDRRSAATGRRRPAALLGQALDNRRAKLVDAPESYGSVAVRAQVAARAAYLDRVGERLEERDRRSRTVHENFEASLSSAGLPSLDRIEGVLASRESTTPDRSAIPVAGPDREMNVSVDAEPSYLALAAVNASTPVPGPVEEYHPLAARNVNAFTVPYGDAADAVADGLFGGFDRRRVDLRTAALALRAANRTLDHRNDPRLAEDRDELRVDVDASLRQVRRRLASTLARESTLGWRASRAAVDDGLAGWNGTAGRALAVANGSAAAPVAAAAVERLPADERTDRRQDWLRLRVRLTLTASTKLERARPPQGSVDRTATRTRAIARTALTDAVESGTKRAAEAAKKRWFGRALSATPAGLPVTPIPGQWYATVNVWHVEVGGTYARFTVRARHGTPGSNVEYTRTNRTVRVDVDGDGDPERLGRNEPVSFRTTTVVLVAVPPGGSGVGDVDGDADERSPGWPPGRSDNP